MPSTIKVDGIFNIIYSETLLASLKDSALVSGAQAIDTRVPMTKIPVKQSIVFCTPRLAILIGSKNVLAAEPNRLMAVAKPTPEERMSVGKLSAGKTPTRLLTADKINVNTEKAIIIRTVRLLGNTLKRPKEITNTMKEEIKKPRLEYLIVNQIPNNAPIIRRPFNKKSVV